MHVKNRLRPEKYPPESRRPQQGDRARLARRAETEHRRQGQIRREGTPRTERLQELNSTSEPPPRQKQPRGPVVYQASQLPLPLRLFFSLGRLRVTAEGNAV